MSTFVELYNQLLEHLIDLHEVPVFFDGAIVPNIYACIGRYPEGSCYILNATKWSTDTVVRTTHALRRMRQLRPFESVGNPHCSKDRCIMTQKFSDIKTGRWDQLIRSIPAAATTMAIQCYTASEKSRALKSVCTKKQIPDEIEYIIRQYISVAPTWKTWARL
jgi:hypothetical protein